MEEIIELNFTVEQLTKVEFLKDHCNVAVRDNDTDEVILITWVPFALGVALHSLITMYPVYDHQAMIRITLPKQNVPSDPFKTAYYRNRYELYNQVDSTADEENVDF